MDLTKRQQEIFDFIKRYSAEHGYPPTVRDIGKAVGLASSSTVHAHLANLEKLGLLRRDPSKPRAIELLDRVRGDVGAVVGSRSQRARRAAQRPAARRPGRGRLSRSSPRRTSRTTSQVPGDRRRRRGRVRPARARRVDEGRRHPRGRLRRRAPAGDRDRRRDRRRARRREEATVKRFFREADHVRLQPENATMEPIRSKDVQVARAASSASSGASDERHAQLRLRHRVRAPAALRREEPARWRRLGRSLPRGPAPARRAHARRGARRRVGGPARAPIRSRARSAASAMAPRYGVRARAGRRPLQGLRLDAGARTRRPAEAGRPVRVSV